jgi:SAM-dependent methyltransferase
MAIKKYGSFFEEQLVLRKSHAKVEGGKADSYALMSLSEKFKKKFEVYKDLVEEYLRNKDQLKILNIGFGAGNLEEYLLETFPKKIRLVSIDNSETFYSGVLERNKKHIEDGTLELLNLDVLEDDIAGMEFDLIFSRDLNHHLLDLDKYLTKMVNYLTDTGYLLIEDLRFDAEEDAILQFIDDVFQVEELRNDRWLLYLKIIGLVESFATGYTAEDVKEKISNNKLFAKHFITPSRYHFFIWKDDSKINQDLINKFVTKLARFYGG